MFLLPHDWYSVLVQHLQLALLADLLQLDFDLVLCPHLILLGHLV